jgi:hypothetical protein
MVDYAFKFLINQKITGMNRSLVLLLFLLVPLATLAQLKTVWKDARFLDEPLKSILVVSQFHDGQLRSRAENSTIGALQKKGISAQGASVLLVYDSMYYYSTMERKLDSAGIDGILIIKMVEVRETDMYIMPQELIPPYAYNYYEYYSYYYYHDLGVITDPNYYRKPGLDFRIDAYLYQNRGDMVVWAGQIDVPDPFNASGVVNKLGGKLTRAMISYKVVEKE